MDNHITRVYVLPEYQKMIIGIFMVVSALLQHILHEMLHVIVGKYNGLKLVKIQ